MNNKREELIMENQKVQKGNDTELRVRLVGKGYGVLRYGVLKKGMFINIILEDDLLHGEIKGLKIKDKTYFDGTLNEKYIIANFSNIISDINSKNLTKNLVDNKNVSIFHRVCEKKEFCIFEATINLNDFNNTLNHVENLEIIEDPALIKQIKKLLKENGRNDMSGILGENGYIETGYSLKLKKPKKDAEWNKLLDNMFSDDLSPVAHKLFLQCLQIPKNIYITKDYLNLHVSNLTEQELEDGLEELLELDYLEKLKIKSIIPKIKASSKDTPKPVGNCHNTYDSNILLGTNVSSLAVGIYIACIEVNRNGVVSKEGIQKSLNWSKLQIDRRFKELEKLGYIQKTKVYDLYKEKESNIYLFRKALDEDFCDVEQNFPNYKIVKK